MEQQTTNVTVTRTLSKVDEMRMNTEKFTLAAEVKVSGGTVLTAIENGRITDVGSGMHLGNFTAYAGGAQNVTFQNVTSREDRAAVYEAVEDFIEGVTAFVAPEQTEEEG